MLTKTINKSKFRLLPLFIAAGAVLPGLALVILQIPVSPLLGIALFGAAIVASAFILLWAGDAAKVDITGGLALAILAVIAVLPEYAVDLYFAFTAGSNPEFESYAAANMTGSNRLLLGFGWPIVFLVAWLGYRLIQRSKASQSKKASKGTGVKGFVIWLLPENRLDLGVLLIASVATLIIPITGQIHLGLSLVLFVIFGWYLFRVSSGEVEAEEELDGVAGRIAALPKRRRRLTVVILMVLAAGFILACAEPFAHSLIEGGRELGIDDFLLVQWLAPLASESPEFIMAFLMAFRGQASLAIALLIASKVNQWTLLVGSLPVAYLLGGGGLALPMDSRQVEEFTLTIAQTLLGIAVLLALKLDLKRALLLLGFFLLTFVFPGEEARWWLSWAYLAVAVGFIIANYRSFLSLWLEPFRFKKPGSEEAELDAAQAKSDAGQAKSGVEEAETNDYSTETEIVKTS